MFPYSCRPPIPRPEPFSPLPWRGAGPDWGKWIRDRLAEKGALLAFPTRAEFPAAGDAPSLYLAEDTGVLYRWNGAGYAVLVDPASDVETYPGRSTFPGVGQSGVIYIDASANLLYRWNGTGYVLLTSDLSDVESRLVGVELKIPAQATAQNQLADKDFVNSSIATNTATFRGTYNLVTDLSLTPSATDEQVASAIATKLASLVPPVIPENNDYCFVRVPYNETPVDPDHIERIDRYKCTVVKNGTTETRTWGYEFSINNSSFTAAQWAAISSGITSGLVAKLGALPTAEALATALAGKQDVLTFDNAPTAGSNNPVKSGGIWSAIWGALTALPTGFSSLYDWVVNQLAGKLDKSGGTMTGQLELSRASITYSKGYPEESEMGTLLVYDFGQVVDAKPFILIGDTYYEAATVKELGGKANRAANPTAGNLAALDANGNPTDSGLAKTAVAPIASPAFTGTPTAPTPTAGDNSTKVATTAFVQGALPYAIVTRTINQASGGPSDPHYVNILDRTINIVDATSWDADFSLRFGGQTDGKSSDFIVAITCGSNYVPTLGLYGLETLIDAKGNSADLTLVAGKTTVFRFTEIRNRDTTTMPETSRMFVVTGGANGGGSVDPATLNAKLNSTAAGPNFQTGVAYAVGKHVTYNGVLYECVVAIADSSTTPDQDIYDDSTTPATGHWKVTDMTDPDAVLDVTAQNQLRVVAKDGTLLWAQGYDLASTSSATLACDAANNFTFADGATTQAFALPTAPTGKVGDFGLDIDNSDNTGAATLTLTGLDTTFSVVVPEGESLTDMLAIAAGELARFYVTLTTFRVNNLPTWHIVKQVVENGGAQS